MDDWLKNNTNSSYKSRRRGDNDKGVIQNVKEAIFGKVESPEEMAKKWKKEINAEKRKIVREMAKIEREEDKLKKEIKKLADDGRMSNARTLARAIVQSEKARDRMLMASIRLNSVQMSINESMGLFVWFCVIVSCF
eukprot:TRINITY_DN3149_c0_g1_i1.p1 TRINITY_DN3149_c0_g1~~TRINITY_DN3149_c0_g1_i1.p1  ORF type:complete len:137 (-),score=18.19 TRINITY_DN3149_c0_g1_i1:13-423(-)